VERRPGWLHAKETFRRLKKEVPIEAGADIPELPAPDMRELIEAMMEQQAVIDATLQVLAEKCRSRNVIRARHRLWSLLRHALDLSYPEMAQVFEVDHTTIVVAVRKRERELEEDANHT
jgi:chromosomal replication initiation ATPase DnaA